VCEFEIGERPRGRGFCDYIKAAVLAVGARRCFKGVVLADPHRGLRGE